MIKEGKLVRVLLILIAITFITVVLFIPLVAVFIKGFEKGISPYFNAILDPITLKAIKLTLITILVAVPINTVFGVSAAWVITKFEFRFKRVLLTIIDLPFAISPVIIGFMFVLVFSNNYGLLSPALNELGVKIIFSPLGIILATTFVTFPFVARELIPLMEAQGTQEEEAAIILGASGLQTFLKVTLPNIKWGLVYGVVLTIARAAGEFGAVSVVSGHIRGVTNTVPLHVEVLYNEYKFQAAFAVASILTLIALLDLVFKKILKNKVKGGV
ncbi:MAG: sulfate ABC transporter permease subunit CysW [Clostridium sp.]